MEFKVVIPARYASTRLPGKALLPVNGKPIIQFVYENALNSGAQQVIVATDDQRIKEAAEKFDAEVCLTSSQHLSGTDRIAEVVQIYSWPDGVVIVNVQGDEPLMPSGNIRQVAENLITHDNISMSTLCANISEENYKNKNVVKVNYDKNNIAINFSRDIQTFDNESIQGKKIYRHLGIYSYHVGFLNLFTQLPQSVSEKQESLEQLRALDNDYLIYVDLCKEETGIGVDTQEDYKILLNTLINR